MKKDKSVNEFNYLFLDNFIENQSHDFEDGGYILESATLNEKDLNGYVVKDFSLKLRSVSGYDFLYPLMYKLNNIIPLKDLYIGFEDLDLTEKIGRNFIFESVWLNDFTV